MSTIRVAKRSRFTTIDRRTIRDDRLSFRARGVLVWLLDHPDDWSARADVIAGEGPEGRKAVLTALRELVDAGYLTRRKWQDEQGRWHHESVVYERPMSDESGSTTSPSPNVGEPDAGNGPLEEALTTEEREDPQTPYVEDEWGPSEEERQRVLDTFRATRDRHGFVKRDESEVA